MNGPFTRNTERARDGAHEAIDTVSGKVHSASDRFAKGAHRLVDKVGIATSDAADAVARSKQRLSSSPSRMLDYCRTGVREHPAKAVGIAALAGVALYGVWQYRKSRRLVSSEY
jgi:ElaB/YqjD/DUF883 family membrane-anchored ribosome-binding protein